MSLPRLTYPTALVLYAVARGHAYGFDIIDATGLGSGTVYPILRRLEAARLLRGRAEPSREAQQSGRPPRRYYTVTGAGTLALREALGRHPAVAAALATPPGLAWPGLA
jgi:DNA-binding PadR family transcriptional regulator